MKRGNVEQLRIIHSDSLEKYNELINAAMFELRNKEPRLEFHQSDPTYAIIRYTEPWKEAETLADEYELERQIRFECCKDCNQVEGMDDGRRRRYWCRYKDAIWYGDRCCEEFYKRHARGERDWIK